MDTRKTRTIGRTDYVSVYSHPVVDPELLDKYEYMLSAKMDYNSLVRLAEDKTRAEDMRSTIEALISFGVDHSQILSMIKEIFKLTTDEAERYIEQVLSEISKNSESNSATQP